MSSAESSVAVVYLAWLPYGPSHLVHFADSYRQFEAGYPHKLFIAFNGQAKSNPELTAEYTRILKEKRIEVAGSFIFDEGQDIEIYRSVSSSIDAEFVLFLNTFSELRSTDWLKFYIDAFVPGIGLVGATASNQSYYSSVFQKHSFRWEAGKTVGYHFRKYKLFIKAFLYWRFLFKPFPNPHIRTNAFMVRRREFLEMPIGAMNAKFKAYQFESGRHGMTNWYNAKGLRSVIIDKKGAIYEAAKWAEANTFWSGDQENLLVSDNQTALYSHANKEEKRQMSWLAWGKQ